MSDEHERPTLPVLPPDPADDEPSGITRKLGDASDAYRRATDGYTRKIIMWTVVGLFVAWCVAAVRLMSCG